MGSASILLGFAIGIPGTALLAVGPPPPQHHRVHPRPGFSPGRQGVISTGMWSLPRPACTQTGKASPTAWPPPPPVIIVSTIVETMMIAGYKNLLRALRQHRGPVLDLTKQKRSLRVDTDVFLSPAEADGSTS
jgi:hypothetical protein